ncbi:myosin heavy chain [Perilla frutescens var. hirtella]|nr:myosin heavy chain [Perilla frutescens var. hirtella]
MFAGLAGYPSRCRLYPPKPAPPRAYPSEKRASKLKPYLPKKLAGTSWPSGPSLWVEINNKQSSGNFPGTSCCLFSYSCRIPIQLNFTLPFSLSSIPKSPKPVNSRGLRLWGGDVSNGEAGVIGGGGGGGSIAEGSGREEAAFPAERGVTGGGAGGGAWPPRLSGAELCERNPKQTGMKAESRAKTMEEEISMLQKNLNERNEQLQASTSAAEMYVKELDDLRLRLTATKAIADASALSAQSAQKQCSSLANELEEKSCSLREHEIQLDFLQKNLVARELSQMQLKDEVSRFEHGIMQALAKPGSNKHCILAKILDEVSPTSFDNIDKVSMVKDEEITELRDEIRLMSSHWQLKDEELESQLEKHHRADQELRRRVLELEFCLQEGRAQTRKLQRMEERKYRALKELRDQLVAKQQCQKQNFWESSGFKIIVSMSMLILVILTKR